jgi:hypothetical protein
MSHVDGAFGAFGRTEAASFAQVCGHLYPGANHNSTKGAQSKAGQAAHAPAWIDFGMGGVCDRLGTLRRGAGQRNIADISGLLIPVKNSP